jgi:hypothetical protein
VFWKISARRCCASTCPFKARPLARKGEDGPDNDLSCLGLLDHSLHGQVCRDRWEEEEEGGCAFHSNI